MASKLTTTSADAAWARGRARIGAKYLEVAQVVETEDGEAINVTVGLAVLAGIAAGDAVCAAATGERYSGAHHAEAAAVLERVDSELGKTLRRLVGYKPAAHYGTSLLTTEKRTAALRAATRLVEAAQKATT